ncbi:hypothetical protein ISN44_As06g024330 [Arabidopsis suecica]|uniref:Uncharacterized protein n=1 Tax=Arabidopsis suecica TaxID=45249 RepID=A0A8T2CJ00_ARASU|nr:hypothetical protein ISN44_As06g024330 [Arabidopsis suecica]
MEHRKLGGAKETMAMWRNLEENWRQGSNATPGSTLRHNGQKNTEIELSQTHPDQATSQGEKPFFPVLSYLGILHKSVSEETMTMRRNLIGNGEEASGSKTRAVRSTSEPAGGKTANKPDKYKVVRSQFSGCSLYNRCKRANFSLDLSPLPSHFKKITHGTVFAAQMEHRKLGVEKVLSYERIVGSKVAAPRSTSHFGQNNPKNEHQGSTKTAPPRSTSQPSGQQNPQNKHRGTNIATPGSTSPHNGQKNTQPSHS